MIQHPHAFNPSFPVIATAWPAPLDELDEARWRQQDRHAAMLDSLELLAAGQQFHGHEIDMVARLAVTNPDALAAEPPAGLVTTLLRWFGRH